MNAARPSKWSIVGWAFFAALNCAVIMPWLSRACLPPFDFAAFYTAAQLFHQNHAHQLYDLQLQLGIQQTQFGPEGAASLERFLPFYHLPYELLLWLPLTRLSYRAAFWVWRAENLALLVLTAWLSAKVPAVRRGFWAVFFMSLAFFPVAYCLLMGQDSLVILALFAICVWCLRDHRYFLAGAALGLGLFKLQFVLPIIGIMVLRRCWRAVAGFAASAAAVLGISCGMVGVDGMKALLHVWRTGEGGTISSINPLRMPNVRGLLSTIPGLTPHSPVVPIATLVLSTVLLFVVARQVKKVRTPEYSFALSICFVVLVSFHTNVYDLAILLLPVLLLLSIQIGSTKLQWIVVPPRFLLFFTPLYVPVMALSRSAPLTVLVVWSWYALSYWINCRETQEIELALSNPGSAPRVLVEAS